MDEKNTDDVVFEESNEEGAELSAKEQIKKLKEQVKNLQKEKEEYLTGWQRSKADYVNLQKEEEAKRKSLKEYITIELLEDMFPAFDSFDMAFANKEAWEKVDANWRNGVEYIHKQFAQVLENYGVTKINEIGVPFNPTLHESIGSIDTDEKDLDHTIASITQSGYKIGDKVIRPARVKVYESK